MRQSPRRARLQALFGLVLLARLLYPFFNSPLQHLFSDPQRHWDNGQTFLHPSIMGSSDPYCINCGCMPCRVCARRGADRIARCGICARPCLRMVSGAARIAAEDTGVGRRAGHRFDSGVHRIYAYFMNETLLMALLGFGFG